MERAVGERAGEAGPGQAHARRSAQSIPEADGGATGPHEGTGDGSQRAPAVFAGDGQGPPRPGGRGIERPGTVTSLRLPERHPHPTMREVAKLAGVSLKTVSRVVNSEEGVTAPTAEAVRLAIEMLGYRRNDVARNLRPGQRSNTFGLVIEDVANPFYSAITKGAEEVAGLQGFMVLTASSEEQAPRERELVGRMVQRQIDGLLLVPTGQEHGFLANEMARGLPVVALDRPAPGLDTDLVVLDNQGGARAAVEHLLGLGHSRIAVVGDGPWVWTVAERLRGYHLALARAGIASDERFVRLGPRTAEEAEEAALSLLALDPPPTAIFALNNRATVGVLRALLRTEVRAVEVVGFDDLELADMLALPVSTVAHDAAELGREATRLLLARLVGDSSPPRTMTVGTKLVVRPRGIVW